MSFSFSFSGDDIDETTTTPQSHPPQPAAAAAFPIQGKPLLPPHSHPLPTLLSSLPSKIAYDILSITLDDGSVMRLPRRELWDVRCQLMAEDDSSSTSKNDDKNDKNEGGAGGLEGLGESDVKTGVYEGGFKSWESSLDLVRVLAGERDGMLDNDKNKTFIELGCGTALPSLALFQWTILHHLSRNSSSSSITTFTLADYNPSVLHLVTLPNLILTWALTLRTATTTTAGSSNLLPSEEEVFSDEDGEVNLTPDLILAFQEWLKKQGVRLCFLSGGWCDEFVQLLSTSSSTTTTTQQEQEQSVIIGAETIYSPFALQSFTETMFSLLLQHHKNSSSSNSSVAFIGAKKHYFGVGGSLDDFVELVKNKGGQVEQLREETDGVRRGVVRCFLS